MTSIDVNSVDEEGLVFVRHNTIIGYCTCVITDQPFDSVGLYFTETITGVKRIRYLLIDPITGMKISGTKDYGPELSDLVSSQKIMRIAVAKLKSIRNSDGTINTTETLKRRYEFRLHITAISNADTRGWADYVRRLFGKKLEKSGSKYNSIDMINVIVKLITGSLSPNWNSTDVGIDPRTVSNIQGAYNAEFLPFLQNTIDNADEYNVPIQTYIYTNNVFGDIVYLDRSLTESQLSEYFITEAKTDESFKTSLTYFESFMRTDDEFLTAVINGMQVRLDRKYVARDILQSNLVSSNTFLGEYLETLDPSSDKYRDVYAQIHSNNMITGQ